MSAPEDAPDLDLLALAAVTEPDDALVNAVWRGFDAQRQRGERTAPVALPVALIVGLVAAGTALLALLAGADGPAEPQRLVVSSDGWASGQPLPHVALSYRGEGSLDVGAPALAWRWGEVVVDVTPGAGPPLTVRTQEAAIAVVGTRFAVERSALGTEVRLERGHVVVTCRDGGGVRSLAAGQSAWCLPVSAAQLLARVDRLIADGAPPPLIHASVERGLERAAGQPLVAGELLVRRMEQDAAAGRSVREDAVAYLALPGGARRRQVLTELARETYAAGGCAEGRASLEALHAEGGAPEVGVLLATCLADREPERAQQLLAAALAGELDPEWRASALAWSASLPAPDP